LLAQSATVCNAFYATSNSSGCKVEELKKRHVHVRLMLVTGVHAADRLGLREQHTPFGYIPAPAPRVAAVLLEHGLVLSPRLWLVCAGVRRSTTAPCLC
jgi:hypothetical protein